MALFAVVTEPPLQRRQLVPPAGPQLVCRLELASVPSSVYWARRQARDALRAWSLAALTDTAALVASELVTNALQHPRVPKELTAPFGPPGLYRIALILSVVSGALFIEVFDRDPTPPQLPAEDLETEHGRGLLLVRRLCRHLNYFLPRSGGKVVWAELTVPAPATPAPSTLKRVRNTLWRMEGDQTAF